MLDFYEESGINPSNVRVSAMTLPQTYNNKKKGVARFIFKKSENVATTHCCMHNLNLRHFVLIGHALRPPNFKWNVQN